MIRCHQGEKERVRAVRYKVQHCKVTYLLFELPYLHGNAGGY